MGEARQDTDATEQRTPSWASRVMRERQLEKAQNTLKDDGIDSDLTDQEVLLAKAAIRHEGDGAPAHLTALFATVVAWASLITAMSTSDSGWSAAVYVMGGGILALTALWAWRLWRLGSTAAVRVIVETRYENGTLRRIAREDG